MELRKIKLFKFPSFEEFYNNNFKFKITLGEYICTSSYNKREIIISFDSYRDTKDRRRPLSKYIYPIKYNNIKKEIYTIEKWYNNVILNFQRRWKTFIENTYLEFDEDTYRYKVFSAISRIFDNYQDAEKYAKADPKDPDSGNLFDFSYSGQIIGVYESDKKITAYIIESDKSLKLLFEKFGG